MTGKRGSRRSNQQDAEDKTYYFARPAQAKHTCSSFVKPVLITQMQLFGSRGCITETVDMYSVSFFASRISKDVRRFTKEKKCSPRFVIMRDVLSKVDSPDSNHGCSPGAITGAIAENETRKSETRHGSGGSEGTFWSGGLLTTMSKAADGTYEMFINTLLVAKWKPKRQHQHIDGFELEGTESSEVLAQLQKDRLTIVRHGYTLDVPLSEKADRRDASQAEGELASYQTLDMVLTTGAWIAHVEGWLLPS